MKITDHNPLIERWRNQIGLLEAFKI